MVKSLDYFPTESSLYARYVNKLNKPVNGAKVSGDVGIEIELEGNNFPPSIGSGRLWQVHQDGSLRNGGQEFVLAKPIKIDKVEQSLDILYDTLGGFGTQLARSNRTSVHVHINVSDLKVNQLVSFFALWAILEDVLVDWCGPDRVGNLFCLRLRDAEWTVGQILYSLQKGTPFRVNPELRYSALNLCAFSKFGSFEFRPLGECHEPEKIKIWVEALWAIKSKALTKYQNPLDISSEFSGLGGVGFLRDCLEGTRLSDLLEVNQDTDFTIWQGLRRIQPILNALPWDKWLGEINKEYIPNPFNEVKNVKINREVADDRIEDLDWRALEEQIRDWRPNPLRIRPAPMPEE